MLRHLIILGSITIGFYATTFSQTLDLKPGLYQMKSKITIDGKDIYDDENYKKMMEEQKKAMTPEMIAQMKKMNIEMPKIQDPTNIQSCIKAEDLTAESIEKTKDKKKCKYTTLKHTTQEMHINFNCNDGTKASSVLKIAGQKKMTSHTTTENPKKTKGRKTEIKTEGQWISSKCTKESMSKDNAFFNFRETN